MAIFTGVHVVEFLASVTAALLARAARAWFKHRHAPSVGPVSDETRAHLLEEPRDPDRLP
jgi:hypothetical protein